MASSSPSTGITTTTGPKISSRAMRIWLSIPPYAVGPTKLPSRSSASSGTDPPAATLTPSLRATAK